MELENELMICDRDTIRGFFDMVIDKIENLVSNQVDDIKHELLESTLQPKVR